MTPTVKSMKVYAIVESTIELGRCTPDQLHAYLKSGRFSGQTSINYSQGGVSTIITREHIPLTMQELDAFLKSKQA